MFLSGRSTRFGPFHPSGPIEAAVRHTGTVRPPRRLRYTPSYLRRLYSGPPSVLPTVRPNHASPALYAVWYMGVLRHSLRPTAVRRPSWPPSVEVARRLRYTPFGGVGVLRHSICVSSRAHAPLDDARTTLDDARRAVRPAHCPSKQRAACAIRRLVCVVWRSPECVIVGACWVSGHRACVVYRRRVGAGSCVVRACGAGGSVPECVSVWYYKNCYSRVRENPKGAFNMWHGFSVRPPSPLIQSVTFDTVSVCNRQIALKASKWCCRIKKNRGTRSVCGMGSVEW